MNKEFVLLRTLLLSTSQRNSIKYCKDTQKRKKVIGNYVKTAILFLMLMAYCIATSIGYGQFGMAGAIPLMCAAVISILSFFLTLFKTNGYLFNFKEYDMLMSLPFAAKNIAACRFAYMYLKSLPWYMSVSAAMMIGYGVSAAPSAAVYPIWVVLSLFLPVIPMLASAFLGFLIAKIGSGFRNKNIAMTVLSILLVLACFGLRFFFEDMFRNDKVEVVLTSLSGVTDYMAGTYLPIGWFGNAVTAFGLSDMLLLTGISVLLFSVTFIPVGRSYRKINSALRSHAAAGGFVMKKQTSKSMLHTIVFKEFKRMTGSTTYMTNALIGEIICAIAGLAVLFLDMDELLKKMLFDAPLTKEMLYPAIPWIVYFMIGMVATTVFTPSLEGRNYWIVQSLPIRKKTLYQGKMLFNLYLTVPFALFATVAICISAKAPLMNTLLYVLLEICLCAFSSAWGCVCGIKHMRLDWENEVEVIKQGTGIMVYLFPNMLVTMGITVLVVFLGTMISPNLVTLFLIGMVSGLAALSYRKVTVLTRD